MLSRDVQGAAKLGLVSPVGDARHDAERSESMIGEGKIIVGVGLGQRGYGPRTETDPIVSQAISQARLPPRGARCGCYRL
jgi:hypothetical protein